jgi:hypothetical protein
MAGVQITQERLSAALRAITRFSICTGATRERVIARGAGSYSASIGTCGDTDRNVISRVVTRVTNRLLQPPCRPIKC